MDFAGVREWVGKAKASGSPTWAPLEKWLDKAEGRFEELDRKRHEAEQSLELKEEELVRFTGIEERIQDIARGLVTFHDVLDEFELDPHGLFDRAPAVGGANGVNTDYEIPT